MLHNSYVDTMALECIWSDKPIKLNNTVLYMIQQHLCKLIYSISSFEKQLKKIYKKYSFNLNTGTVQVQDVSYQYQLYHIYILCHTIQC